MNGVEFRAWLKRSPEEIVAGHSQSRTIPALRATRATLLQMWVSLVSDESRALMFIALDNLHNQELKLAIAAVPENPSALASKSGH